MISQFKISINGVETLDFVFNENDAGKNDILMSQIVSSLSATDAEVVKNENKITWFLEDENKQVDFKIPDCYGY